MKKNILIIFVITHVFTLLSCNNFSKNDRQLQTQTLKESIAQIEEVPLDILQIINKVPISQLPLGISGLDQIDTFDMRQYGFTNLPFSYEIDKENKYGLNDFFSNNLDSQRYDANLISLGASYNQSISSKPTSIDVYLSKRLPPIGENNLFLCKIIQTMPSLDKTIEGWCIYMVNADGKILDTIQIGQVYKETNYFESWSYILFYIDNYYQITLKAYAALIYDGSYNDINTIAQWYKTQYYKLNLKDSYIELIDEQDNPNYTPEESD